jgi:hypothetical protein
MSGLVASCTATTPRRRWRGHGGKRIAAGGRKKKERKRDQRKQKMGQMYVNCGFEDVARRLSANREWRRRREEKGHLRNKQDMTQSTHEAGRTERSTTNRCMCCRSPADKRRPFFLVIVFVYAREGAMGSKFSGNTCMVRKEEWDQLHRHRHTLTHAHTHTQIHRYTNAHIQNKRLA